MIQKAVYGKQKGKFVSISTRRHWRLNFLYYYIHHLHAVSSAAGQKELGNILLIQQPSYDL